MACDKVTIDKSDINEIKSALGYPLVAELDWGPRTDDYIEKYVAPRVLRFYYTYFPIIIDNYTAISGSFEIDYPDADVFRKLRHFFNYKEINYASMSPFLLQSMIMQRGSQQPFDIGQREFNEIYSRLSTAESIIDYDRALQIEDKPHERKVTGFSNLSGNLTIQWAKKSDNFDTIAYNYKDDAIKLGKAYLIQDAYRLREQAKVESKVTINSDALINDATRWEEEVTNRWRRRGFAVVVK